MKPAFLKSQILSSVLLVIKLGSSKCKIVYYWMRPLKRIALWLGRQKLIQKNICDNPPFLRKFCILQFWTCPCVERYRLLAQWTRSCCAGGKLPQFPRLQNLGLVRQQILAFLQRKRRTSGLLPYTSPRNKWLYSHDKWQMTLIIDVAITKLQIFAPVKTISNQRIYEWTAQLQ